MNDEWFLYAGEQEIGPYTDEQLRAMLAAGELTPESYVRRSEEPWRTIVDALPPHDGANLEIATSEADAGEAATEYALAPDAEDEETEIELANEQPDVAAEEPEYAIQSDEEKAGVLGPMIAVSASPTKSSGSTSAVSGSSYAAKRSSTAPARRTKKSWTQDKNVMLIAAIVVGGLAAILVGKLVLWMIRPTPKPDPYGYGARPAHTEPADRRTTA